MNLTQIKYNIILRFNNSKYNTAPIMRSERMFLHFTPRSRWRLMTPSTSYGQNKTNKSRSLTYRDERSLCVLDKYFILQGENKLYLVW